MFAVSVPLLLLAAWKPGAVGGGDVKLMAAGGSLFGANGIWQAFFTGILLAGIWTIVMLLCKRVKREVEYPAWPVSECGNADFFVLVFLKVMVYNKKMKCELKNWRNMIC